ncbi:hypothetical protein E2C01_074599 [Portunus trituberculatus]|uniref:Uncharacterized protein n=1 Tax=Portunus trituberculatus TaxID=210409 RepID=A0A5B7IDK5_PORTR|nr:hypothetical protein [Portunus trituberculatus]
MRGREAEGRGGVWRPGGGEGCGGGGWWWWWLGWGLDKVRSGETKCQVEGQSEVVCCRDRRSVEVLCWVGLCIVRSDEAKEDTQRVRCFSVRRNSEEVQPLPPSCWRIVPGGVLWRLKAAADRLPSVLRIRPHQGERESSRDGAGVEKR